METKTKFSWRAFTSLYITLSLIVMIISGIILYIAPPGRIANWTYISLLGLEKEQWQALHTIFTFLFIIANGFHLYFNWKPFISYLSERRKQFFQIRKELFSAIFVTAGIFYLILLNEQPFKTVIDFGESMKNQWSVDSTEPPIPHAEDMTIGELAKTVKKDPEILISNLKQQGITAELNSVIKEIADKYDISPRMVYEKMNVKGKSHPSQEEPKRGYGRMSVEQVCDEKNIHLEDALLELHREGIEATGESTLRDLALQSNKSPSDIVKIIEHSVEQ